MATRTRKYYLDTINRKIYAGYNSLVTVPVEDFFLSDQEIVQVIPVVPNPDSTSSQKFIPSDFDGSYYIAAGLLGKFATGGQFSLTDPITSTTKPNLDWNISASALQAALRTIATYSACTVQSNGTGDYTVDRVTVGVLASNLTGDGVNLFPDSFVNVNTERIGTSTVSQVVRITLDQKPAAYTESGWTDLPVAAVSVTTLVTGTASQNAIYRVSINSDAFEGSFILSSTVLGSGNMTSASSSPINFDSTDVDMQAQIIAGWGAGNEVTVLQVNAFTWDVQFTGNNIKLKSLTAPTGNPSGLTVPNGFQGKLDFRTNAAYADLAGQNSVQVTFQIKNIDGDGVPQTWFFASATLNNSLINPATLGSSSIAYPLTPTEANAAYQRLDGTNGPATGNWNLGAQRITNLGNPVNPQDAVTKSFALSMVLGVWQVIASDLTAQFGDKLAVDTTGGNITITLPAATGSGAEIQFIDPQGTWVPDTGQVIVTGTVNGDGGGAILEVTGGYALFVDVGGDAGWRMK